MQRDSSACAGTDVEVEDVRRALGALVGHEHHRAAKSTVFCTKHPKGKETRNALALGEARKDARKRPRVSLLFFLSQRSLFRARFVSRGPRGLVVDVPVVADGEAGRFRVALAEDAQAHSRVAPACKFPKRHALDFGSWSRRVRGRPNDGPRAHKELVRASSEHVVRIGHLEWRLERDSLGDSRERPARDARFRIGFWNARSDPAPWRCVSPERTKCAALGRLNKTPSGVESETARRKRHADSRRRPRTTMFLLGSLLGAALSKNCHEDTAWRSSLAMMLSNRFCSPFVRKFTPTSTTVGTEPSARLRKTLGAGERGRKCRPPLIQQREPHVEIIITRTRARVDADIFVSLPLSLLSLSGLQVARVAIRP